MRPWLHKLKQTLRLRTRWIAFRNTPPLYRERFRYALRRALWPEMKSPVWVTSPATGTRFFLSDDLIDDAIAQDIIRDPNRLFPQLGTLGRRDGVILDIGGHHGLYAAEALQRYANRKIVVVEPHPGWCELIKKNLAANGGATRSRVVNACLADDHARRSLRFDPNSSWGATVQAVSDGSVTVEVDSMSLLDILQGEPLAMIYCNAEGAEYALVAQLRQYGIRPVVMVMCVHPEYGDAEDLRQQVRNMGYKEQDASANPQRPVFHYTLSVGP